MVLVKVWCVPNELLEKDLNELESLIRGVIIEFSGKSVANEQIVAFFPERVSRKSILSKELVIEVEGKFKNIIRAFESRQNLAERIGKAALRLFPRCRVTCYVVINDPDTAYWSSEVQK